MNRGKNVRAALMAALLISAGAGYQPAAAQRSNTKAVQSVYDLRVRVGENCLIHKPTKAQTESWAIFTAVATKVIGAGVDWLIGRLSDSSKEEILASEMAHANVLLMEQEKMSNSARCITIVGGDFLLKGGPAVTNNESGKKPTGLDRWISAALSFDVDGGFEAIKPSNNKSANKIVADEMSAMGLPLASAPQFFFEGHLKKEGDFLTLVPIMVERNRKHPKADHKSGKLADVTLVFNIGTAGGTKPTLEKGSPTAISFRGVSNKAKYQPSKEFLKGMDTAYFAYPELEGDATDMYATYYVTLFESYDADWLLSNIAAAMLSESNNIKKEIVGVVFPPDEKPETK